MAPERERKHGIVPPTQETDMTSAMLGSKGRMSRAHVKVDLLEQKLC